MRLPLRLRLQQPHASAPDSPPTHSKTAGIKTTSPLPLPLPPPTTTTAIESQLAASTDNIALFLKEQGVALTVNNHRHKHYDYEVVLFLANTMLKQKFQTSLKLTLLLSHAWTLLWCHYDRQLSLPALLMETRQHCQELKHALSRCAVVRRELCLRQVDLLAIESATTRPLHLPRHYCNFSTDACQDTFDSDLLHTVIALDLEQSTVAIAAPPEYRHVPKTLFYTKCGHFCATCPYSDYGVCPICCYDAEMMSKLAR